MISAHLLAWLTLAGRALDLLGGLYLAYDLPGGRRGPLRTLARAGTYAVAFGALYTAGLPLKFGPIAGAGLGVLLGVEYGIRVGETVGFAFAVLRGATFGLAGAVVHGARLGEVLGIGTSLGLLAVYRALLSRARLPNRRATAPAPRRNQSSGQCQA
jgi:hypothetical protein